MNNNNKSNNNWLIWAGLALIAVLVIVGYRIVAVSVGPVKVEFNASQPDWEQQSFEQEEQQPATQSPTQRVEPVAPAIPSGIESPNGIVSSSETIIADGYTLNFVSVTPNPTFPDFLRVTLVVTNYSSDTRLFRFVRNSVQMRDDTGKAYANDNPSEEIFRSVQVEMPSGEPIKFISTLGHDWESRTLLSFWGPIPPSATKLYIDFNGFGPFSGFTIEVDL